MQAFVKLFSRGKLEGTDSGRRTVSAEPTFRETKLKKDQKEIGGVDFFPKRFNSVPPNLRKGKSPSKLMRFPLNVLEVGSLTSLDKVYLSMAAVDEKISFNFFCFNLGINSLDALWNYNPKMCASKGIHADQFLEVREKILRMKHVNYEELVKQHKRNDYAETCKSKGIPVINIEDVMVLELIAAGPYAGFVCSAHWTKPDGSKERVCLRHSHVPDQMAKFLHEAEMGQLLQHDDILRIHGVIIPSSYAPSLALVVQFAEYGNLVEAENHFTVKRLCHYTSQAAAALEHLEKKNVVHQSIGQANFLLVSKSQVKLAGLGACQFESTLQKMSPSSGSTDLQEVAVVKFARVFSRAFLSYVSRLGYEPYARKEWVDLPGDGFHGPLCPTHLSELFYRCLQEGDDERPSFSVIQRLLAEQRCPNVRVVRSFSAETPGDLSGKENEIITLISKDRNSEYKNLWFGQKENEEIGFFRKDFVEELLEESVTVPPEIRTRGPRAQLAFQKALRNGKVQVYRGRIMLVGQDRAGKTSLKKSLLGLPFNPLEESTVGVEMDPSKFEVDVDQVKNWQRTEEKKLVAFDYVDDIARMVAGELTNSSDSGHSEVNQEDSNSSAKKIDENYDESENKETVIQKSVLQPITETSVEIAGQVDKDTVDRGAAPTHKPPDLQLLIDSAAVLTDDVNERIIEYLQRLKLEDNIKAKEAILTLWDFAGQHLYYASHSVFFSSRAVYVLVYNLNKELSAAAEPCVRQGIHEIRLENPNNETNLDSLLSWLVSIHSIRPETEADVQEVDSKKGKLPYLRPPVFVVGTNADQPFEDANAMETRIKRSITGKTYEKHVIRPFFRVDNKNGLTDEGVRGLREKIMEILRQEPYMGEEVPIRWFNFEKIVEALVAKETYHIDLDQLLVIIREVCFIQDEEELVAMLNFYHDLGVIVKHGRTVVLQAQWLIDLFKKLITVRPFDEVDPIYSDCWCELENSGILRMELVNHVFADLIKQGLGKQDMLDMMELYGLIAKFCPSSTDNQVKYFVPAQLRASPTGLSEIKQSASDPCPLYFHFLDGFVPQGLFMQVVSRCIHWCSEHGPKRAPNLYHNGARFFVGKQTINDLILICKKQFIKVVLKQRKPNAPVSQDLSVEIAHYVRVFLEQTLLQLSSELPWLRQLRYEVCVVCPRCLPADKACVTHGLVSCTQDECLHLVQLLPGEQLICEKSFGEDTLAVSGLVKWFHKPVNENEGIPKIRSTNLVAAADQPMSSKSGSPSTDDLLLLAHEVGKLWKLLGRALGLNEPELEQIDADKPDLFEKCYGMLRRWTEIFGSQATYKGLAKALNHRIVQRPDLAAKYCDVTASN